ncbi:MAG: hypothetical protein ABSA83_11790 [Verrucomicrobiota bacterium]|jgi:hypothetical protein
MPEAAGAAATPDGGAAKTRSLNAVTQKTHTPQTKIALPHIVDFIPDVNQLASCHSAFIFEDR